MPLPSSGRTEEREGWGLATGVPTGQRAPTPFQPLYRADLGHHRVPGEDRLTCVEVSGPVEVGLLADRENPPRSKEKKS